MTTDTITHVTIYQHASVWCYAARTTDPITGTPQHDHSDTLGITDDATESDARAEAAAQFPSAVVDAL